MHWAIFLQKIILKKRIIRVYKKIKVHFEGLTNIVYDDSMQSKAQKKFGKKDDKQDNRERAEK